MNKLRIIKISQINPQYEFRGWKDFIKRGYSFWMEDISDGWCVVFRLGEYLLVRQY